MSVAMGSRVRLPSVLWLVIAVAWGLALIAQLGEGAEAFHHDALFADGVLPWVGVVWFLVAWQIHVAAMMLPASLPMIRLFGRAAATQPHPGRVQLLFLAGYAAVWAGFGALAFAGDAALHEIVARWGWLRSRPWLIAGTVLMLAGAFQFSDLKQRCLKECRLPSAYLRRNYKRGIRAAWRLGVGHGLFCLGCCWALMLVMFAVGIANLAWMAPLALLMFVERTTKSDWLTAASGIGLVAVGALAVLGVEWVRGPLAVAL